MRGPDLSALAEPVSAETAAFNARLAETLASLPKPETLPPAVTRAARDAGQGVFLIGGPREGSTWRDIPAAAGGPGRARVSPPDGAPRGVYLHIHGGGWTFNAPDYYDLWNQRIARETGLAVVSVAYRLAPEHPWPACAEDVAAAARWLIETGAEAFGPGPLIIGGESAGAHLGAVALARLAAEGRAERFAAAVLTYGIYDLRLTPSAAAAGADAPIVPRTTTEWFVDNLTGGDRALRADPALSPLLGDVSAFPPSLLTVGTADPLLDDTLLMAARLTRAGVPAETLIAPGGVHAFDQFDPAALPIAEEALAARIGFLRRVAGG